jgi:cytochrome P450
MKTQKLPQGYTFLQSLVQTYKQVKNPIGTISNSMKRFDGTYSVNLGTRRIIATQDPAFIDYVLRANHKNYYKSPLLTEQLGRFLGNGLLTSNGEYWLKQRRLIQPGFHSDKIHALYTIIGRTVNDFLKNMPTGAAVDVYPLMNTLAFEIVINTLFNIDVPAESRNEISTFINDTQDFVVKDIRQPYKSWWFELSGEVKKNHKKSQSARNVIRHIIQERKHSNQKFNDLLDMLLDARYEDNGDPMNEEQIIDEIMILIIAGHETTGNALSWALYLLATHPAELDKLKQTTKGLPLNDCVQHDRLAAVIKETMRLYPPAWVSDRVALQDDAYGDFLIRKDTIVLLYYYGLHRDEKHWHNPLAFTPDRFLKSNIDKEKAKAYFPFGGGPRLCIGNNFAMAEMAIFLQAIVQQFDVTFTSQTPKLNPLITLRPDRVILGIKRI